MKQSMAVLLTCLTAGAVGIFAADTRPPRPSGADLAALVHGNNAFAGEVYERVAGRKGNLFFSPFGIYSTLNLALAGARDRTEAQMSKALNVTLRAERWHPAFASMIKELARDAKARGCRFAVTNTLWAQRGYDLRRAFLFTAYADYGAELRKVDFANAVEDTGRAINLWCRRQTGGRVPSLIKPENLDGLTQLVLTNTVYFRSRLGAGPGGRAGGLALADPAAFGSPGAALTGLLRPLALTPAPKEPRRPKAEEESVIIFMTKLSDVGADGQTGADSHKYGISSRLQMRAVLDSMKMSEALSRRADLSGLDGLKEIYVTDVVHQAVVAVDENGTEAAAATAVILNVAARAPIILASHGDGVATGR